MRFWITQLMLLAAVPLAMGWGQAAFGANEELDDTDVTLAVETELILEDSVPSHKIDVSTENGIVTLSGSVNSYYSKLEAEATAESVKGVVAVINNIVVQPLTRLDSRIRSDIISALALDPVTESYEIDVTVENGTVTLNGEVDSFTEKRVAEEVTQDVRGVVDVQNLLTYELVGDRIDSDIRQDIEYRLKSDGSIDAGLITVSVADGKVTLDGSVGSAAEKREAEDEAWIVPGVASVENKLDVNWWVDATASVWQDGWTDEDMEAAVENALLTNPRVSSFAVATSIDDGVAKLTGTVDNLEAKRAAEREALDVLGVWRVKNFLRVRPTIERQDGQIARDVRDALQRNPYVDRYEIAVTAYNGKVFLSGDVDSWYMKNQAEKAAAGVLGVVDIQNNLDVNYQPTAKTDAEIKEDIEGQLWWSPFVDSDDIEVEVHSGVATLIGSVEDWDEFQAAEENARQGGATEVVSQLTIENGNGAG